MPRTIDVIIQREAPHQRFIDALRDIIGMYPSQYEIRRRLKIIEIMNSYPPPKPWPPPPPPPPQYMDPGFVINGKAIQMDMNARSRWIKTVIVRELNRQVKEMDLYFTATTDEELKACKLDGELDIIALAAAIDKAV